MKKQKCESQSMFNVRRVSGENMATALDDDVASLLAGLDGPESSQVHRCGKATNSTIVIFREDSRLQRE